MARMSKLGRRWRREASTQIRRWWTKM